MRLFLSDSLVVLLWGITCRFLLITRLSPQVVLTQRRTWLPLALGVPKAARRKPNPSYRPWRMLGGGSLMAGMVVVAERPASGKVPKGDYLAAAR